MNGKIKVRGNKEIDVWGIGKMKTEFTPEIAKKTLDENGLDEVFIKIGDDTYIAYGQGLKKNDFKKGSTVSTAFGSGVVLAFEDDNNSPWENVNEEWEGLAVGAFGLLTAASSAVVFLKSAGAVGGGTMAGIGMAVTLSALGCGLVVLVGAAWYTYDSYKDGKKMPTDFDGLKAILTAPPQEIVSE